MTESTQTTVDGEQLDQEVEILTTGRVLRPFKQMVEQIVGGLTCEYRIDVTEAGLQVEMTDSANVVMIEATLHSDALEAYTYTEEFSLGISKDILGSVVQHARYGKQTDDEIRIQANPEAIKSTVTRDLHGVDATFTENRSVIDADAIRDRPNVGELEFPVGFDLPVQTFIGAVEALDMEHCRFIADETLQLKGESDLGETNISLNVDTGDESAESIFSMDYVEDIRKALHVGKVDDIHLRFADDYPLMVDFERENAYSGRIMVSPRIEA